MVSCREQTVCHVLDGDGLSRTVLQKLVAIDYTREMVILAVIQEREKELLVGVGQYAVMRDTHTAEIALAVRDECQGRGTGTELLDYLSQIARRQGLLGFTADVLGENRQVMSLIEKSGLDFHKEISDGVCYLKATFRE
jgi:GNAT superfamily N-acetyltransferase